MTEDVFPNPAHNGARPVPNGSLPVEPPRFNVARFRSSVDEVAAGVRAVAETIHGSGDPSRTARAMIELAPRLVVMAEQLELLAQTQV